MSTSAQHITIAPSLLAADFGRLRQDVAAIEAAGADWLHLDIMDDDFVPNLSFGRIVLAALRPHGSLHPQAGPHLHRSLQHIDKAGTRAGVVLEPARSPETVAWALDLVDIILVMSVNPGFGGQSFLPSQLPKIRALRRMIGASGHAIGLAVDGGISPAAAPGVIAAGADTLIAGSSVFHAEDHAHAIAAPRVDCRLADADQSDARRGDPGRPNPRPTGAQPIEPEITQPDQTNFLGGAA